MINNIKFIEILITVQSLFISTMLPVFITLPFTNKPQITYEFPITWQIPFVIFISYIYKRDVVIKGLTIYIFLGLFIAPIFHQGGSLGYLLTPNFGYLIGIYPLIFISSKLNKKNKIQIFDFIKNGILAIIAMHTTGIIYNFIQMLYYKQSNLFLYNLGYFSLGKIGYHILMLIPLSLLIKPVKFIKNKL